MTQKAPLFLEKSKQRNYLIDAERHNVGTPEVKNGTEFCATLSPKDQAVQASQSLEFRNSFVFFIATFWEINRSLQAHWVRL